MCQIERIGKPGQLFGSMSISRRNILPRSEKQRVQPERKQNPTTQSVSKSEESRCVRLQARAPTKINPRLMARLAEGDLNFVMRWRRPTRAPASQIRK